MYNLKFGISPFVETQTTDALKHATCSELSLNPKNQQSQMDLHIRYVEDKGRLSWATLLRMIFNAVSGKSSETKLWKKVVQVSMAGYNVNKKFFQLLINRMTIVPSKQCPVDVRNCALHTVNNCFNKCFPNERRVQTIVPFLYYLFHDSPLRREDFVEETGCNVYH